MIEMTTNYVANPLSGFWKSFLIWTEIIGHSRAAAYFAQQGQYDLAKRCMMEVAKLKKC
jgi:hypothetical protein